jgi:hypothetical protein
MWPNIDDSPNRCRFIGGSDARIIMGNDEDALVRLWREKRGEEGPPDYSDNLGWPRKPSIAAGTRKRPDGP